MNHSVVAGRLTRDPDMRYTQTGRPVLSFSIAVNRAKPKDGGEQKADYFDVTVWGDLAENCGNLLHKGKYVRVEGPTRNNDYQDKEGRTVRRNVIDARDVLIPVSPFAARDNEPAPQQSYGAPPKNNSISSFGSEVLPDEDIPF